jgi:hypothetical protein
MTTELGAQIVGPAITPGPAGGWLSGLLDALARTAASSQVATLPLSELASWGAANVALPLILALLIWSWLASWWAYERHRQAQPSRAADAGAVSQTS